MPPWFHLVSVWLHILAATAWIGGMAALGLLLVPLLRQDRFEHVATLLIVVTTLAVSAVHDFHVGAEGCTAHARGAGKSRG